MRANSSELRRQNYFEASMCLLDEWYVKICFKIFQWVLWERQLSRLRRRMSAMGYWLAFGL